MSRSHDDHRGLEEVGSLNLILGSKKKFSLRFAMRLPKPAGRRQVFISPSLSKVGPNMKGKPNTMIFK
jgi:hypothetical protein